MSIVRTKKDQNTELVQGSEMVKVGDVAGFRFRSVLRDVVAQGTPHSEAHIYDVLLLVSPGPVFPLT